MTVYCNRCGEEVAAPGGILLGPPELGGRVSKYHLCIPCYRVVLASVTTYKAVSSDG